MTAIILLLCGLMGVGFLLVNIFATGDDPYYNQEDWDNGTEQVHPRYDIMPNMVPHAAVRRRGRRSPRSPGPPARRQATDDQSVPDPRPAHGARPAPAAG